MNRWRPLKWLLLSVACLAAVFLILRRGEKRQAQNPGAPAASGNAVVGATAPAKPLLMKSEFVKKASTAPIVELNPPATATNSVVVKRTNAFPYRLSNTTQTVGELSKNRHAILLENALIDSDNSQGLTIPDALKSDGDPGAYIVQARGQSTEALRSSIAAAGASIVSYIPNNAYLVRASAETAQVLSQYATVTPWEPYFKVKTALMRTALAGGGVDAANIAVFPDALEETKAALDKMGISVATESPSPFGTELALRNVGSIAGLASLPGVEEVEPSLARVSANDLTRVIMSDSTDTISPTNYLNLSGSNVLVAVSDFWERTNGATKFNPDLMNIIAPADIFPVGFADPTGHATHVGGIIAGSGKNSPTNAFGSLPNADFRGKAPNSILFALPALDPIVTDAQLQREAATTNALISNNSWNYGASDYNLAAANYDQAVRDSVPGASGSQPLIYVFAAGNNGQGDDDGLGGVPDTLLSPAVAKNVLSIGASELPRGITNNVTQCDSCNDSNTPVCVTNQPWAGMTDSPDQVARFSGRGNVGIGVEGDFGRFKPDLVAPGTFVVSTRSPTWDTNAYDNPISIDTVSYFDQIVDTNSVFNYSAFVPCDAVNLSIFAVSTQPTNVPLPIYVNASTFPAPPANLLGVNSVSLPPDAPLSPLDTFWYYSIGNPTNVPVRYDVTSEVTRTNELGDYFQVLQGLNDQLVSSNGTPHLYRYESGTSMAAPAVSGTLALMEDYFTNTLKYTPSPALMKALLINGARSINSKYDFQVKNDINYQGWGLVNLTNSIPIGLTNGSPVAGAPTLFVDQSLTNSLATGDSRTFFVTVDSNALSAPLRVTLVWTDPPGNPAASIKLVNNLDLIVTNMNGLTNPPVYFGNDFASGELFSSQWNGDTNNLPQDDVNNVENVYVPGVLGTNYSITVVARDVNVNAVTSHTNGVVQDFALVISSANGDFTNALTLTSGSGLTNYAANLTTITNQFADSPDTSGGLLLGQRAGASSPLQGTNTLSLTNQTSWDTNGQITIGVSNQWHFYVITNAMGSNALTTFTNAAFVTFLPVNLSVTPLGVDAPDVGAATRPEADIDLYVARGPDAWGLTNLDPTVIANASKSLSRGGTETIIYSNAQPDEVFYVGVKAEDQEAAEYGFAALFSENPFSQMGPDGQEYLHGINVPTLIPDGSATKPGISTTIAIGVQPIDIRRVVVTNFLEHQNIGDLVGSLNHGQTEVVLNNHFLGNGETNLEFIYEDNGEGDVPGSQHTDGPGTLQDFTGQQGIGVWLLQESDNALFNTGRVDNVFIRIDPQQGTNGVVATIQPNSFFYDYIDVPPNATNLTVCVNFLPGSSGPVQLYLRRSDYPTLGNYDYTKLIPAAGDCLSISRADLPPLRPGRYYVGIFNPTAVPQTVRLTWTFGLDPNGALPTPIGSTNGITPILDDAVTNDTIFITNNQRIVTVNVGVVINHPRISDLDLTLISPEGQRILLFENRGGVSATNMGHLNVTTNFFGTQTAGGFNAQTNVIGPITNSGVLLIDYNFHQVPDTIDVYYDGVDIFSPGLVSNPTDVPATFVIPYGPGASTNITIIINKGNNDNTNTAWTYTPRVVSQDFTYLTFTDDTNLTEIPIKFALPPYDAENSGTNFILNDFELATNGLYAVPGSSNIFDLSGGWNLTTNDVFVATNYFAGTNLLSMASNMVSVVTDPATAANGSNFLALARGSISRTIPLNSGKNYTINYVYRGPGIAGWWRGEGDANDSADPENLGNNGSLIGRFNFPVGEVGQAFAMEDSGLAFQFAGTNTYVQVRQSPSLDVGVGGGFTVEGWIDPTNTTFQQPLVEWLARVPTNQVVGGRSISNLVIEAGPFLNRANNHYYYLLGPTNWTTSELWANALGGHLAEIDDANEENWVYDSFAQIGVATNYTMWIGLTNGTSNPDFTWSTGASNITYTNWDLGQPTNCPTAHFTAIEGPTNALPGLWNLLDNNGLTCGGAPTNKPFGVVEVNEIQTNGVQFWISVTNAATPGNGRLYANIVDTNSVSHEIFSPAGLIQSNVFQHVALTYNTNTGMAMLYYNGTNVATTNLGIFVPKTGGDVLLGKDMSRVTNNFFWGRMDEMSIYSRFLSPAEILAIYRTSASTTNRNIGKFDPAITPSESLAEAQVVFNGTTNIIFGHNSDWQVQGFTLTAPSDSLPLQITGLEPGMLLDSFNVSEHPPGNLYYLPEQPLQALVGSNAFGNWTLEIRDARTGAPSTNADLVSWQLQFILETNTPTPLVLSPQTPGTNTIPPGQIGYFSVDVPSWASFATNVLVSATAPVDLLFNQNTPPGLGDPGDFILLNNSSGGSQTLNANPPLTTPPLLPGQHYYLGVRNNGTVPSTVVVQVNYDITTLTNGIPVSSVLRSNEVERPFAFNVSTNATEATFQLLKLTGNADLVLRKGLPLPNLLSSDYGSFAGSNADETIYVLTNSLPVPLSPGLWYLDVFKRDSATDVTASNTVRYAVLAKELVQPPAPTIINLTNRVPVNFTAGPGAALTNFFKFSVTNFPLTAVSNLGIRFELFNQTGNGDLTVQTNAAPLAPPFLQSSRLPGNNGEIIFMHTNSAMTNLVADWYLGVPNNETNPISFTILAQIDTNGLAAFPTAEGSGASTRGGALGTNVYHVINLSDSGPGSLRDAVTQTNGAETVVFDVFGTINLLSPLYITNSFLTIAGQTAPGDGITVAGATTYVQDAHDLIVRYLRFRPTVATIGDSLQFTNVSDVIVDHISAAYGTNDVVSVLNSSNVTVQWSVVAESLDRTNIASGGSEIRYGSGNVTLHHNLYADNYSGNPTIGEDVSLDFVNNVIYNWGIFSGFSTNDLLNNPGGLTNFLNYSANYLIAGSNSVFTNLAFWSGTSNTWIFQTNNFIDTNQNSILDGANTSWGMFSNQFTEFSHPFAIPPTAPDEAFIAYERVLDFAGNSMFTRDAFDREIVQRARLQPVTNKTALLSGMISWWPAENNGTDIVGGHNATPTGGITYTIGEVGQAFVFNGASYLPVTPSPSLDVGAGNGVTIEGWIKLASGSSQQTPILEWDSATEDGLQLWVLGGLQLFANLSGSSVVGNTLTTGPGALDPAALQHVAFTYDKISGKAVLYVNGAPIVSQTFASVTPQTSYPNYHVNIGLRDASSVGTLYYKGLIDELAVYSRALSPCEISAIYNAANMGKQSILSGSTNIPTAGAGSTLPFVDVDRDGIPDFWEITLNEQPTNFSPNLDRDGDGYTDLEEYMNWLGVPHALTVTNTTTNVDLYIMSGNTGNLLFGVSNGTNGSVYLTNTSPCLVSGAGNVAVFTPTNNFGNGTNCGFASFNYMVTNTDTRAYFGPVTVSVFVSAVPITNVPPYTNIIVFTNPPNVSVNESNLLTVTNVATESVTNLTLTYTISTIIDTNATVLNGWPLTNLTLIPSPVIDPVTGVITWTPTETQGPGVYTITTVVTDNGVPSKSATNTFDVTVNEVNLAPFWPPNIPSQTNYTVLALTTLTVTNTASDVDIPGNPLSYMLLNPPVGATIDTNGIFTWTPTLLQAPGIYTITNVVTDTNAYALFNNSLSATNTFTVTVTVPLIPLAFTQPAQAVTGASARLNGMATPNGLPTMAWFEWGTNTLYGNQTPAVGVGSSFNVVYTKSQITGLITNVPYHFRLVVSNVIAVTKGFDQILDEAKVVVWGADYVKQAEVPPGLSNVVAIAGAYDHSLALRNNGTVVAWGDNTFTQTNVPAGLNNVLAVAGGQYSSMALKNGGTVVAWGGNILSVTNVPPGLNNVVMIAGGTYASLALQNSGNIVTWGANFFGVTNVPVGLTNVVEVAGGSYHSLAIRNDGTVMAWGDNSAGQTSVPPSVTNVVAIAGGNYHSLALRSDGTVVAWGDDSSGQTNVPAGLSNVVAVAAGGFHSLALKSDGTVVGWGDNTAGQAGIPAGLSNVVAISSGYFHSLALTPTLLSTNPIILPITNGVPETNTVFGGSTIYYRVNVPTNADAATNTLIFTVNGPLNIWYSTNVPPTVGGSNDFLLITNSVMGTSVVDTATSPELNPGTTYYLGIQNTNLFAVSYAVQVDFDLVPALPSTNAPPISGIIQTNIGGTNGFLLIWFAPTNDLFKVQWSSGLPPVWNTFTNIIGYHTFIDPTNSEFEFFDDGSQTGGLSSPRFYNLVLLNSGAVTPPPTVLTNGVPVTNTVPAGSVNFYQVNVPVNVDYVTNILLTASLPLNMWFSTNVPPTVTNATDFHLLTNSTAGSFTSVAGSVGPPFFVPGTTYYLGVQNTNVTAATFGIEVDFHLISTPPMTNSVPISTVTQTNINGTNGFLLVWFAPTNDLFQVQWSPGLLSSWNTFTNIVGYHTFINPTNSEFEFFDDGSQTGGFASGRFYQLILLNSGTVTPALPILTSGVSATSNAAPGTVNFYQVNVPTNVDFSTNLLLSATVPLNVWFSTNVPPTVMNATDFHLLTNATAGSFTSGSGNGGPPLFVPGTTYYLGVQNTNVAAATYSIEVSFHVVTTTPPVTNSVPISTVTQTNVNGTNGFLMVWFAPTNELFQVQWSPGLLSSWNTFTNIVGFYTFINPTNSEFEFFDDGSQTGGFASGRYYQLILLGSTPVITNTNSPATNTIPISSVTTTNIGGTNSFFMAWFAPSNDLFQVQWSVGLLSSWNTFTNIIGYHTNINSTTAEFEFIDDGSQTGGFGPGRYYRLVLLNGAAAPSVVVVPLANGVPLNFTTGVGSTNFFSFDITQTNAAVLFELYNLSGNGDLMAQRSNLPMAPPYSSVNLGTNSEQIVIRTNSGLAHLNAISWFLGVPNRSASPVSYTIRAVVPTNGILVSALPFSVAASLVGGSNMQFTWSPTIDGEKYEIRTNGNFGSTNWGALTDVVAVGTSQNFTVPLPSTGSLYYRIVQVP